MTVVVDPVKRMLIRWPVPKVLQECKKGPTPPLAYLYAACPVVFPARVLVICASLNHGAPRPVLGDAVKTVDGATHAACEKILGKRALTLISPDERFSIFFAVLMLMPFSARSHWDTADCETPILRANSVWERACRFMYAVMGVGECQ